MKYSILQAKGKRVVLVRGEVRAVNPLTLPMSSELKIDLVELNTTKISRAATSALELAVI
jgi:hypothetical protein